MTHQANVSRSETLRGAARIQDALELIAVVVAGVALGAVLWSVDGPPHVPASFDWGHVGGLLTGSRMPDADAVAIAAALGWTALGYLAISIALRAVVIFAARGRSGARWVRAATRLSDLTTVPAVRRAVDRAAGGMLLLATWLPVSPGARIGTTIDPRFAATATIESPGVPSPSDAHGQSPNAEEAPVARSIEYAVLRGDSLWDIARRFYGDGSRYPEIISANWGRFTQAGGAFSDQGAIEAGWSLAIPLPAATVSAEGGQSTYRVQRGDDLWGIAARFMGDGFRWPEIWELNRGREMDPGRRFADPNMIQPGWQLALPITADSSSLPALMVPPPTAPVPAPQPTLRSAQPTGASLTTPRAEAVSRDDGSWGWPSVARRMLFTTAGFAVLGGTAIFVRRVMRDGVLRRRSERGHNGVGDAGRVTLATRALRGALADFGFRDSRPLFVVEREESLEFAVDCPVGDGESLVNHRHELARRLACTVDGEMSSSTRVTLRLSGFHRLAALLINPTRGQAVLPVPVGATEDGILYMDLAAVGSVSVSGSERERGKLVAGWLQTLGVANSAMELSMRLDRGAAATVGDAAGSIVDGAANSQDAAELAAELDEIVLSRSAANSLHLPIVAVLELTDGSTTQPEPVLQHGPTVGVFMVGMLATPAREHGIGGFGAAVTFAEYAGDSSFAGEEPELATVGQLVLSIGRDERVVLEPVRVRTDTSTRWSEESESVLADRDENGEREAPSDPPATAPPEHTVGRRLEVLAPPDRVADVPNRVAAAVGTSRRENDPQPALQIATDSAVRDDEIDAGFEWRRHEDGLVSPLAVGVAICERPDPSTHATGLEVEAAAVSARPLRPNPDELQQRQDVSTATWQEPLLFRDETLEPDAPSNQRRFAVRCFDRFSISIDGRELTAWPLQRSRELLAYLVARGETTVTREEVAEALWPEETPEHVERLLADAAYRLRKALKGAFADAAETQFFVSEGQRYRLRTQLFRVDVDSFNARARRARSLEGPAALREYEQAIAICSGDFLERDGYEWAAPWLHEYRKRFVTVCREAARLATECRDIPKAATFYEAILKREPIDEDAARELMRCYARRDDPNGVRKVYKVFQQSLRQELDDERAEPTDETTALLTELTARPGAA